MEKGLGLTGRRWGRAWVFAAAAMLAAAGSAVLASNGAGWWQGLTSDESAGVTCDIYPIALPETVVSGLAPGARVSRLPRGTGSGNFSWLTWDGSPSAPTLAQSLISPGDSHRYVDPDGAGDTRIDIGDWAQGAPGSMNSKAVRTNLDALLRTEIVLPTFDDTRGAGNQFGYRVKRFAVVRLHGFELTGNGWLDFEFVGYKRCYNQPPKALDQALRTPEDTPLTLTLTGSDSQNDPLTFELLEPPAHGTLSGTAPDLVYTPAPNFNGPDRLTFRTHDGQFDSAPGTVTIEVVPVNDPPRITSTPVLEAADNVEYRYPVTAEDIDIGDRLSFRLDQAPSGMRIDPTSGLIEWTPTIEQVGEHVVTVTVTDLAGASDTQTYRVVVERSNRPPAIISAPNHDAFDLDGYRYPVVAQDPDVGDVLGFDLRHRPDGMSVVPSTGVISWNTAGWAGNNRQPNAMCMAGGEQIASLSPAADVVVVVDESGSMDGEHAWIADFAAPLEAHLTSNGVGEGESPNRYGLLAYDPVPLPINVGATPMGNYQQFITASAQLRLRGSGTEDGWRAVRHAILQYPLRSDAARNIILVTDEDRDNTDSSITYASLLSEFRAQRAVLNAVVNARFRCGDGTAALGLGQNAVGYKADGRGGFVTCPNTTAHGGDGTSIDDYVKLALATGGAAWDIDVLRDGGVVAQSFTNALLKIKVQEILQQLPTRNLPDVYVHGAQAYGGQVTVNVGNRGLAPVGDAIAVQLLADDRLIDTLPLGDLPAGALEQLKFSWMPPAGAAEPTRLSVRLFVPPHVDECKVDNNTLDAAWVRVRATDRGGLFDEQAFSVQVVGQNDAPRITSTPALATGVGQRYAYNVAVIDPDRGDAVSYELARGPIGMVINRLTGELTFIADAAQQGAHTVEVLVRDLAGAQARQAFTLTVDPAMLPPRFASAAPRRAVQGTTYTYAPEVTSDPASTLRFDVFLGPDGFAMDPSTGQITWSVPASYAGKNQRVVLRVRDQFGNYDLQVFTLLGDLPNQAPRIVSTPGLQATTGSAYSYSPTVSDVNVLEAFNWSAERMPGGAAVDTLTGRVNWPASSVVSSQPAAISASNPYCVVKPAGAAEFAPRQLWANTRLRFPTQPLVGPIADTDLDGELTSKDLTAVVALTYSDTAVGNRRLHALDARTGDTLWSYNQRTPDWYVQPAMADLEGEGNPTVLFVDQQRHLVALRSDGTQRWVSATPVAASSLNYNAISISDLDGDGLAEILVGPAVYSAYGTLKWQFPAAANYQGHALAIDLDRDGSREVLFRGEIRDANGVLRARLPSALDGTVHYSFHAPIVLPGTTATHVVVSENTSRGYRLSVVDAAGKLVWLRTTGVSSAGPVTVADFDSDGAPDIFHAASGRLYSAAGEVIWDIGGATNWSNANFRAAVTADLDRDGELEILVANTGYVHVVAGRTGAVLWRFTGMSDQHSHTPTLVDIDGSGNAMLLISEGNALRAYTSGNQPWSGAARVVHQQAFALDQVRSDLRINPADVSQPPAPLHVFGAREGAAGRTVFQNDLRISAPYGRESGSAMTLWADVRNRGTAASAGGEVAFYRGGLDSTALIGKATLAPLAPGASVTVTLATDRVSLGDDEVTAAVLVDGADAECELGNNAATGRVMKLGVTDHGGLGASQTWVVGVSERMLAPTFASTAGRAAVENQAYRYLAQATSPHLGDVVTYELSTAPDGASVDPRTGEVLWTPRWRQTGRFTFVLTARSLNGQGTSQSWTVDVTASTESNRLPTITSQPVTAATLNQPYRYDVRAMDPDGQRITFELERAPAGMQIDSRSGTILWVPGSVPTAPVDVTVAAIDERLGRGTQTFALRVYATPNRAPGISTTPTLSMNLGASYEYVAAASDPDGDPLQYLWNVLPDGAVVDGASTVRWTPTAAQVGEHAFELEVRDDRGGWVRQTFTVFVNNPALNAAPQITSTPNPRAVTAQAYRYEASATDADGDTLEYTLVERPQGMTIEASTGVIAWTPTSTQLGEHRIKLQAHDGRGGVAWQTFTVTVADHAGGGDNGAPVVLSAPAASAKVGYAYSYDVRAEDPERDAIAFSLVDAPAGMQIDAQSGRIAWTPSQIGEYAVRVRVSDGRLWTEQAWNLAVVEGLPLEATLHVDPVRVSPNETVSVQVVPKHAASQVTVELRLDGTVVPVDAQLRATVRSAVIGRHVLTAKIRDGVEVVETASEFLVLDPNSTEAPVVTLTTPNDDAVITAPTKVLGAVTDVDVAGWKLTLIDKNGTSSKVLATGTGAVSGELGTLDPTLLLNGQYVVVLQAWDVGGNEGKAFRSVVIDGEMKLGHFSLTFEDVSIPVMGMPITVSRTYDTRRSHERLDFGFGWSVGYQNVRIHESRTLGLGWSLNEYRSGFFSNWCVEPQGDPIVTIAMPDGSLERFRAKAIPECQFLVPTVDVQIGFEPLPGTHSKLEQTSVGLVRLANNQLLDLGDVEPVDPDQYRLTLKDGTVYDLDQGFGIRQVTDLDGNSLTYGRNGITHSSGVGIQFIRDSVGRIRTIKLPDGNFIDYAYNAVGDLTAVVDQTGGVTQFGYLQGRYPHYLQDIVDARGIRAARNEFGEDGRLTAHIDADGQRIEYVLDLDGRIQTVKDRRGFSRTYVYDEHGRITQEINALGEATRRTYDSGGNELSRENAEGETWRWDYDANGNKTRETNPLGQVTVWAYDSRGQVLSQTDATGQVTVSNVYNSRNGQLTATTDALGQRTDFVYSPSGGLTEMRQPDGTVLRYAYDVRGNKTREIDAAGSVVEYTYDEGGRVLTETRTRTAFDGVRRTLVTRHAYDAKGRKVSTTNPLGHVTRIEYDAVDREIAHVDAKGHRTEFAYDAAGNLVETRYPDGTVELRRFDAENNLVSRTDRGRRTTAFVYDAAGRLVETRHPDGGIIRNGYDRAGRKISVEDARGFVTRYSYDDAGRVLTVIDARGHVTATTYNAAGVKASVRDALGRVTKFVHDAAGRLLETVHPDATSSDTDNPRTRFTYDPAGRKTGQTDEMGRTTSFEYTIRGQLAAVVDALGQRTEYAYDELGHKTVQRDALGRTTRWAFDDAGREVARVLPGGQTEVKSYDPNGNLISHTDFNGAQTVRTYDAANRVIEERHADGTGVVTTYTGSGQVATQTDAAGTTVYGYDARDRPVSLQQPDGIAIAYTYDLAGNRTRLVTSEQDTGYAFDELNRLASVSQSGQVTTFGYDAVGNRASVVLPNGVRSEYAYDLRNRLRTLVHRTTAGAVLLGLTYTTDASGLRTQAVEQGAGVTRTVGYQYDALKRLTREQVSDSTRGNRVSAWTYDAVGNRLSQSRTKNGVTQTTTYVYDSNDRLEAEHRSSGSVTYRYDANGSLIEKNEPAGKSLYSYDGGGRLVDALTPTAGLSYRYDANGIRQSQTVNGVVTRFVVDPVAEHAQVLEERSATIGAVVYVVGDDRIARRTGGQTHYLHADGLGSTRLSSAGNGAAADRWWYEAFGETESHVGTSDNAFLFAGEQLDPNLGFYYLRARYMDPGTGRFATLDVYAGDRAEPLTLHKYLYANASPTFYTDPSGYFGIMGIVDIGLSMNLQGITRVGTAQGGRIVMRQILFGRPPDSLGIIGEMVLDAMVKSVLDVVDIDFSNKGAAGTAAHQRLKEHMDDVAARLRKMNVHGITVHAEPFADDAGEHYGRGRKGAVGIDVLIKYRGENVIGFDLKIGKGYSQSGIRKRRSYFGDVVQVNIDVAPK